MNAGLCETEDINPIIINLIFSYPDRCILIWTMKINIVPGVWVYIVKRLSISIKTQTISHAYNQVSILDVIYSVEMQEKYSWKWNKLYQETIRWPNKICV